MRFVGGATDLAYWNMAGPFGGWIASQLLGRVLDDPDRLGDPVATSTSFVGAIAEGPFTIGLRRLRTNRSTDFWWTELRQVQDGVEQVCAYATVALARRPVTTTYVDEPMPQTLPPEDVPERRAPMQLRWFELFELRIAEGVPFAGDDGSARSLTWTRKRGHLLDARSLTEICDSAVPRIFYRTRRPIPVATVTMNVFFHATASEIAEVGDDYVLCDARWHGANDGYFDEQQLIWSRTGRLLATTDQLVWYREPGATSEGAETRR
jgi:acyl-CoA thioesterase